MTEEEAVAFRFQKASCVVVGTFNIYILHPKWLSSHGIIDVGTEAAIETNLNRPGFRWRFANSKTVWNISPTRVSIETEDPEEDCGAAVAKVLDVLRETPVFGLGNNTVYQADLSIVEALSPSFRDFHWPDPAGEGESIAQRTFHIAVKQGEHKVANLQLALKHENAELACNVHTNLEDRPDATVIAVEAAKDFLQDRTRSKDLIQHFLATSVDHDPDNA